MKKGFAALIGLLIGAIIMVFIAMAIIKSFTKSYIDPTTSQTIEDKAQKTVTEYQKKAIENQTKDLNLDTGN